jgi:ribosomal protein S18 acetylase RimI-like enzyme
MDELPVELQPTSPDDAGELLTLQRAAFVTEAQVYGDPNLQPLVQTLRDLERELERGVGLKAVLGHRMVGAIRGRVEGHTCHIGRLAVAPDMQGRGIGSRLLEEFEARLALDVARFELYVGSLSLPHVRLFERFHYQEFRRERMASNLELVFMEKPSPGAASSM